MNSCSPALKVVESPSASVVIASLEPGMVTGLLTGLPVCKCLVTRSTAASDGSLRLVTLSAGGSVSPCVGVVLSQCRVCARTLASHEECCQSTAVFSFGDAQTTSFDPAALVIAWRHARRTCSHVKTRPRVSKNQPEPISSTLYGVPLGCSTS